MHSVIESLMNNDASVVEHFSKAKEKWQEILSDIKTVSVSELAKRLSFAQSWFEANCGGRDEGKIIMPWTAFASIYSTQDGYSRPNMGKNEAIKLAQAFAKSSVSIEVKGAARDAARSYYLSYDTKTKMYTAD